MERCETGTMGMLIRVMRLIKPYLSEDRLGMRMIEFIALGHLRDMGGVTSQQALGEDLYVDRNNLVLLLNELEDLDYVGRRRDPNDRRRHIVALTPTGKKALLKAEVSFEAVAAEALVGLDEDDRERLRDLLGKALLGACAAQRISLADDVKVATAAS
jgi:DNA-binding MarR family transcriptional regulator